MLADLDLLLITVYCAADDTLPRRVGNARRRVSNAEIVTLAVAGPCSTSRPIARSWDRRTAVG